MDNRDFSKTLRQGMEEGKYTIVPPKTEFRYEIPDELTEAVGKFIVSYQQKHPAMNKARVMRKAAEHFKLKQSMI